MSFRFTGLRNLEKSFNKKLKKIENKTSEGLEKAANYLLDEATPLVPVDTGRLRASGIVISEEKFVKRVEFEAIDPKTGYDYAPIQHENLSFKHSQGQAKFLEQPFRENQEQMLKIIAEEAKKGVEK